MSSAEEDHREDEHESHNEDEGGPPGLKKRKIQRACDICRRKKVRCDGATMPNNRCTNCITYNHQCTYVEAAKKRGPPKGYVEGLENRVVKLEKLLKKLCPDPDVLDQLGGPFNKDEWLAKGVGKTTSRTSEKTQSGGHGVAPKLLPVDTDDLDPSDDEATTPDTLEKRLKTVTIDPLHPRFFGKSSSVMFLQTAMSLRRTYADKPPSTEQINSNLLPRKRPEFWRAHPWIIETMEQQDSTPKRFPPPDLMNSLIDKYFERMNLYIPLMHRPTFQKSIVEGLHLYDEGFASTVLLVCALGARHSDDPRVILPGTNSGHSAGWEWFRQVQWIRRSLLSPPRLYDLQISALTAMFLHGSSTPQASWIIIGVGIRLAQDVGAHRRKVYNQAKRTIEDELWKRAFWVLVALDRFVSSALGRPCAIHDEDFDLDMPLECDDEYWANENPDLAWKQPAGKPSTIAYFNSLLRLNQILAFALRTIYSINKSKVMLGFVGPQWEQHIVAELDSAMNKWVDSVPDHLRWDPNQENEVWLLQSASLYATYYHLQIIVHRPFIPSPRKPSPLSFPSLAICTNAARSCIHVLDVQFERTKRPAFNNLMSVFSSGIVLLLSIWGGKKAGLTADPVKGMEDVHKAMKMLKVLEPRWHTAGRIWDIMFELASVGDLPLPRPSPTPSNKRDRDGDSVSGSSEGQTPESHASPAPSSGSNDDPIQRQFAGSKRAYQRSQTAQQQQTPHVNHVQPPPSMDSPMPQDSWRPEHVIPSSMNVPPMPNPTLDPTPFAASLQGWFGYDNAEPSYGPVPQMQHGMPSHSMQPHPSQGMSTPSGAPHMSQPLDMGQMPSTQSMMYDQALSNLSASLSSMNTAPATGLPTFANVPQGMPPNASQPTTASSAEDFDELLAAFGAQYGAAFPDFTDDGGFGFNMWPVAEQPQANAGFEGWDMRPSFGDSGGVPTYPGPSQHGAAGV